MGGYRSQKVTPFPVRTPDLQLIGVRITRATPLRLGPDEGEVFVICEIPQVSAHQVSGRDTKNFMGGLVGESEPFIGIGLGNAFPEAFDERAVMGFSFPQLPVHLPSINRRLQRHPQFFFFKRLEKIADRTRHFCPFERGLIGVRRDVDHRKAVELTNPPGGLDPVHFSPEPEVHEDEIRGELSGQADGVLPGPGYAYDLVAKVHQHVLCVSGHKDFVFDDEDAHFFHCQPPRLLRGGNRP